MWQYGLMEIDELVRKYMRERIFTAAELMAVVDPSDLSGRLRYSVQQGNGAPAKSMGILLANCPQVEKVGSVRKVSLWRIKP